jgi:hypothetical protein
MSPVMALSVSRWRNLERESSKALVILTSCIAVMVVTTLRGVHLIYSHDTMLIGVTEPIMTYEFCIMLSMISSSVCRGSEVDASSIVSTKLPAALAVTTLSRSTARSASSRVDAS